MKRWSALQSETRRRTDDDRSSSLKRRGTPVMHTASVSNVPTRARSRTFSAMTSSELSKATASVSDLNTESSAAGSAAGSDLPPQPPQRSASDRSLSLTGLKRPSLDRRMSSSGVDAVKGSTHPASFLFQHMHHLPYFSARATPIEGTFDNATNGGGDLDRTVRVLDKTPALHSHKIGVIYVGRGQTDSAEILRNTMGSAR